MAFLTQRAEFDNLPIDFGGATLQLQALAQFFFSFLRLLSYVAWQHEFKASLKGPTPNFQEEYPVIQTGTLVNRRILGCYRKCAEGHLRIKEYLEETAHAFYDLTCLVGYTTKVRAL